MSGRLLALLLMLAATPALAQTALTRGSAVGPRVPPDSALGAGHVPSAKPAPGGGGGGGGDPCGAMPAALLAMEWVLDGSAIGGTYGNAGVSGAVAAWTNLGTAGGVTTADASPYTPTYSMDGVDGQDAIAYDNQSHYLPSATTCDIAKDGQGYTVMVFQPSSLPSSGYRVPAGNSTMGSVPGWAWDYDASGNISVGFINGTTYRAYLTPGTLSAGVPRVLQAWGNGTAYYARSGSGSIVSAAKGSTDFTSDPPYPFGLGWSTYVAASVIDGQIAFFAVGSSYPGDVDRAAIETWLDCRYPTAI